jgi:hypothetical protein
VRVSSGGLAKIRFLIDAPTRFNGLQPGTVDTHVLTRGNRPLRKALSLARQSNPSSTLSLTSVNPIESHLQLVLLGTAGDLGELGLRDAGHEPLQATKGLGHLSTKLARHSIIVELGEKDLHPAHP